MSVKRCTLSQCTRDQNSILETAFNYLKSIKVSPHLSFTVRVEHSTLSCISEAMSLLGYQGYTLQQDRFLSLFSLQKSQNEE